MSGINKSFFTGRLGHDPELKKTPTGLSVCSFSIACERMKGKDQEKAEVDWIKCVAWRGTADSICDHLSKGDSVFLECHAQVRSYDDRDGKKQTVTEFVVDKYQNLGWATASSGSSKVNTSHDATDSIPPKKTSFTKDEISHEMAEERNTDSDISSDDLPF